MKKLLLLFAFIAIGLSSSAQHYPCAYVSDEVNMMLEGSDSEVTGELTHNETDYILRGKVDPNSGITYLEITTSEGKKVGDLKIDSSTDETVVQIEESGEYNLPTRIVMDKKVIRVMNPKTK